MALLIGCLALFLAAGYWLMGRVDAFLARSVVCEAGTKPRNDGIMARRVHYSQLQFLDGFYF